MKNTRVTLPKIILGLAIMGVACLSQRAAADYAFPNTQGVTYEMNLTSMSTILGPGGTTNLPANASTTADEGIGLEQVTAITANGSGPNLITSGTVLEGMFGDLQVIAHLRPVFTGNVVTSYNTISDITPSTGPINFQNNDLLFFGALGRNPLTNPGDAGSGGYLLLSDNKTGFSYNGKGQGSNENPQGLALNTGGFSVSNAGVATNNDNYTNAGPGTAIDPNHVVLAAKFQNMSTMTGLVPPSGITDPLEIGGGSILPAGTLFIEQATSPVSSTNPTALTAQAFGFLNVVGGSSASSFLQDGTFNAGNTAGSVPFGGTSEVALRDSETFNTNNIGAVGNYTQWANTGDDPANYFGSGVPEPCSMVLFSLGLGCTAVYGAARRSRRKAQV